MLPLTGARVRNSLDRGPFCGQRDGLSHFSYPDDPEVGDSGRSSMKPASGSVNTAGDTWSILR